MSDPAAEHVPPVMILCGGKGTRMRELGESLPKPMVPIGEQPILWHIMKTFAAFGVRRFILCLGYKRETFIDYFMNYHLRTTDATITLGHDPKIRFHGESAESDWQVTLAGTGLESRTGTRILRAEKYLLPEDREFFLTYGDGLSDVDLASLASFHRKTGKLLTVTGVHPPSRFGEMTISGDLVTDFQEKPALGSGYINGGFMMMNRSFIRQYLSGDRDEYLEAAPMAAASRDRQLAVYRHEGFWQCMDTPREFELLNRLWSEQRSPWTKNW